MQPRRGLGYNALFLPGCAMLHCRRRQLPFPKIAICALDIACVCAAILLTVLLRMGWHQTPSTLITRWPMLGLIVSSFAASLYVFGLYEDARLEHPRRMILASAMAAASSALFLGAVQYAAPAHALGRGIVFPVTALVLAGTVAIRHALGEAVRRGVLVRRCLVIGSGADANRALDLIARHPSSGLRGLGYITPSIGAQRATGRSNHNALGTLEDLESLVERLGVDQLVLAGKFADDDDVLRRLRHLRYQGVDLVDYVTLFEQLANEVPVDEVSEKWLLNAVLTNSQFHVRRIKRLMDVVLATIVLIPVGLLVFPAVALLIKLTSKGPIFFTQERIGLNGRPFMLIKFRTMRQDAETHTGPMWSTENDPRITPVGRHLRKYRIDELPQLINVIRGDMSLIGPRPERAFFIHRLAETVPFYEERLRVRPGITGWAQVMAPYAASVEDSLRKHQFDLYYIKHMSLFLDVFIFAKTAKTLIFGRERAQGGAVTSAGEAVQLRAPSTVRPVPEFEARNRVVVTEHSRKQAS